MINEAARSLGRLAKGKPKTMSKAAITQRKRAAKASAKARKGRKRVRSIPNAKTNYISQAEDSCLHYENALVKESHAKHQTEPNAGGPLHSEAPAQRQP